MRHTKSFSLNDTHEAHRDILDKLAQEVNISPVVIQALYHWYFEPHEAQNIMQPDNSDVLAAIAELARKLDNIGAVQHSATKNAQTVAQEETPQEAARLREVAEAEANIPAAVLVARNSAKRPGMRMES